MMYAAIRDDTNLFLYLMNDELEYKLKEDTIL